MIFRDGGAACPTCAVKSREVGFRAINVVGTFADAEIVRLLAGPFTVTVAVSPAAGSRAASDVRVKVAGVVDWLRVALSHFRPDVVATLAVTGAGLPLLVTAMVPDAAP
jgi:hypothetical protein